MKYIYILLTVITFGNSDTIFRSYCVDDFYLQNQILHLKYSHLTTYSDLRPGSNYTNDDLIILHQNMDKWSFDPETRICRRIETLQNSDTLGLDQQNFLLLMGFTGLLSAFLLIQSIIKRL